MSSLEFDSVVCFGGEDWWYHNRGHIDMQLMRRFAKFCTGLYVNSIVMGKPGLAQGRKFVKKVVRKTKSICTGLKDGGAGFWVYSPFSLPVHHMTGFRQVNNTLLQQQLSLVMRKLMIHHPIIWVACPAACEVAVQMKGVGLVYQRTDRYEEYPNVDHDIISKYDRKLKACAQFTVFVNSSLHTEEASQCKKAVFLDHGVDFKMFASSNHDSVKPVDIADVPRPIVGYFGALDDHKIDVEFVRKLAGLLSDMSFVFVGKPSPEFSRLAEMGNVWLLGQKDYEYIPQYGMCFDVAIIPWRQSRWTEAANPIKLKEYLALGKPVVSTSVFTELKEYLDVVYEANTAEEFAASVHKALAENTTERVVTRRRKVESSSWDSKAAAILAEVTGKDTSVFEEVLHG